MALQALQSPRRPSRGAAESLGEHHAPHLMLGCHEAQVFRHSHVRIPCQSCSSIERVRAHRRIKSARILIKVTETERLAHRLTSPTVPRATKPSRDFCLGRNVSEQATEVKVGQQGPPITIHLRCLRHVLDEVEYPVRVAPATQETANKGARVTESRERPGPKSANHLVSRRSPTNQPPPRFRKPGPSSTAGNAPRDPIDGRKSSRGRRTTLDSGKHRYYSPGEPGHSPLVVVPRH